MQRKRPRGCAFLNSHKDRRVVTSETPQARIRGGVNAFDCTVKVGGYLGFNSANKPQIRLKPTKHKAYKNRIRKPFIKDYKIPLKVKIPFGKDEVTGSNPVISSNVKTALESRFQSFSAAVILFLKKNYRAFCRLFAVYCAIFFYF